jgi:hypothetical protein
VISFGQRIVERLDGTVGKKFHFNWDRRGVKKVTLLCSGLIRDQVSDNNPHGRKNGTG